MASFTTRVELHNTSDYQKLHEEMEQRGFSREIKSSDDVWYHLPTAEYDISGNFTRGDVLDKAQAAIDAIKKKGMILVTESAGRKWKNLEKVE